LAYPIARLRAYLVLQNCHVRIKRALWSLWKALILRTRHLGEEPATHPMRNISIHSRNISNESRNILNESICKHIEFDPASASPAEALSISAAVDRHDQSHNQDKPSPPAAQGTTPRPCHPPDHGPPSAFVFRFTHSSASSSEKLPTSAEWPPATSASGGNPT
jgi:hypothetical protein